MLKYSASIIALAAALGLAAPVMAQQETAKPEAAASQSQVNSGEVGESDIENRGESAGSNASAADKSDTSAEKGFGRQKDIVLDKNAQPAAETAKQSESADSGDDFSRQREIVLEGREEKAAVEKQDYDRADPQAARDVAPDGRLTVNEMPAEPFSLGRDILASELIGQEILGPQDESVGDIEDIRISSDGTLQGLIVGVGGFLGLGERSVLIEPQQIRFSRNPELEMQARTDLTRQQLESLPPFERSEAEE